MSLDKTGIKKIAWLARLAIAEQDIAEYSRDLSRILAMVERMNSADSAACSPLAHPLEIKARLREDKITEINQRDKFQAGAPAVDQGLYLVPKVIE
jgi:aspartyl-tRNA(Asn)/glutamyl-tRNA(Gln) amidotransferase subunit C